MDQVNQIKQVAADNANKYGVGPDNTTSVNNAASGAQEYISKGIDAVQSSVFGQSSQQQESSEQPKHDPAVSQAVDGAHPAAVEEFQRHTHRSDPVTDNVEKAQP